MNVHKEFKGRTLVEEKVLNTLAKIGEKTGEFQEWWDTFKSLMSVVRPGSKGLMRLIMSKTDEDEDK